VGTRGDSAPDAVQPLGRTKRPTGRVLALVAILAVVGSAFWFSVLADPPDAPIGLHIPWWLLALMFAATELWVFHIQVGREAQSISISEIPLVLALFYAMPSDLLIARVVGPALIMLLHRRQTMLKAAVNIALLYADTAVALAVFCWVGGGSTADSGPTWVAAVLAASAAMAVDLVVINTIIRWYDGGPRLARVRSVINGVGIATASATLGLVPLLTLRLGSLAAVPLLAAGVVLMVGYRAYASLADRHSSLERLFTFSRELNVVPESTDVLPSVIILGLGLSALVAPLTATALGSLDDAHAGIASGVNNAVARAASLLSVAILPLAAGLGSGSLTVAGQLHPVYRNAMLICVGLMVGGSALAFFLIPNRITKPTPPRSFCDPCSPPVQARPPVSSGR